MLLRKVAIVSEDVIVIVRWFQMVGAATEKAGLPILRLDLGKMNCLKMDELRFLGRS